MKRNIIKRLNTMINKSESEGLYNTANHIRKEKRAQLFKNKIR